ncbi:HAMP domain-containing sensor histidine kinase [sulfur-oxidizing endosymbiont of Gigantopelta aegis]|uniref:HAMP domain-containing sensor histidine kinase n=1 Tax=sulfur-oxidizing endosymbiont of Gigantopelta aegis TaxID=2794934 RepID=UPI0018DE5E74|nr:HAMP domain-containing sensor histidine kinase [sulfur-oxidizing endosymbiont of Gigantopelta aegis]
MARFHLSLFSTIAISLIFLFIGAMLTSGYTILLNQHNQHLEEKERLAYASAKSLAEGSIDALISRDYELLERWLSAIVLKDIYAYGYLSGPKGHIIIHTDAEKIAQYSPTLAAFNLSMSRELSYQGEPVKEIIYSSKVNDEIFANAHIAYYTSDNIFSAFKNKEIYILLSVMVFFMALILTATLFIIRMHTSPLTQLSKNIQNFSFSDEQIKIENNILERPDEIGVLANTFKLMIQRLKSAYDDLKKEKQNLHLKVEQRTKELKQQNELLLNMQEKLVETEKMASLGNLVAGVAHEINTPIGICLTAISYLNDASIELKKKHENHDLLEQDFTDYMDVVQESGEIALGNIKRAAHLISNFKKVAVDQHIEESSCFNFYENLQQIIKVLEPNLKQININFKITGDKTLKVMSYQGVFYQIVSNLVMNSIIHAFETASTGDINIDFLMEDGTLNFKYSDNGAGIPENILDKLFDPFVTTKRGQGGTGLGTHIVYNLVVQKLNGSIECQSEIGKGAQFKLFLPLKKC